MLKSQYMQPALLIAASLIAATLLLSGCAKPVIYPSNQVSVTPELHESSAVMDDSYVLPLRSWGDNKDSVAVVLSNHGLNDYSLGFESTGKYLADRNILLISYDQRGFGETQGHGFWHGSQRMVKDNLTVIRLLREKYPGKPLFLLGESMGGAVVLATLIHLDSNAEDKLSGVILIAPAIWSRQSMPWYQRALLWLAVHTVPAKELTGEGLDLMPSDNIEMLRALGRDPLVIKATRVDVLYGVTNMMDIAAAASTNFTQDALILYGKHDEIVPREPTCEWLNALPDDDRGRRRVILYENGYHMLNRDLQADAVLQDIVNWILQTSKSATQADSDTPGFSNDTHKTRADIALLSFCKGKN